MEYGLLGLIVLVLDIIAILGILKSGLDTLMKVVWIVVVLALPVIGMALWFLIGAKKGV
ncbi:MAG: hypothetical protein GW778_06755 [Alphaproteobacteria bacterium]|nr:hypothetical protein [Alphaproteobacteria bacterium]